MKAVVNTSYGTPNVLEIKEVEKPSPKANEVLIRIHAAVVSSADCTFRKGVPYFARLFFGLLKPKTTILGTEFAGQIEAVGKDVKLFKPGDKVFAASGADFGAHAQYICLAEQGGLAIKPINMTYEQSAAICEGTLTALPFLRDKAKIKSGQKILINGASGSVGTAAVQLAKHFGAEVTGVCSTANLELVKSLGADRVIDYTTEDFTKGTETYDVIFDTVGKSTFSQCKDRLKQGGVYLACVLTLANLLQMLWTSQIASKKVIFDAAGLRPPGEKATDLAYIKELAEARALKPVIDKTYTMEQIAEAHRHVDTGHKKGNVVLSLGDV
ncbi:MAG: NAD(P)-dependent alcohol dehydrogenase [Candidatus Dadabacteria bacterium]|nr:NAD(P)-dependent alcohol dehydrogenase [Candidatus Dadabacteria bacterium]MCH8048499.1 NAD(P)-dependent alcohol dehydrogenase [Patescibacteria group bacterium]